MMSTWETYGTPSKVKPLRNMPTFTALNKLPKIMPRPPNKLVPHNTTAVIASKFSVCRVGVQRLEFSVADVIESNQCIDRNPL